MEDYNLPEDIHFPHDKGYKVLLSSKKVFLELLHSFVHLGWVEKIDPESLMKIDKSCILQDFNKKEADLIYRLKIKDQDVIFYVLIEMQSSVDFQMPYRLLLYMMEIWRDILKNTQPETIERKDFKLPAVIPIVLYNGANNWTACQNYKEYLTGADLFEEYILNFRYILIDVNRYEKKTLLELANLIGSVFLLDQRFEKDEIIFRLKELIGVLRRFTPDEYNLFRMWLSSIATIGLSEKSKEAVIKILEESNPEEVEKMVYNLAETLKKMEEDVVLAREEGRLAREEGIKTVAKNLLAKNTNLDFIAEVTGLSIDEIKKLQTENNDKIH